MKVYTVHEVLESTKKKLEEVTAERDALAAQVEALNKEFKDARGTLSMIASCGLDSTDTEIADVALSESRRWVSRYDDSVLKKTPQQCLADIKAEAGRLGFLEGARQMCENEIGWFGHDAESCAKHYAEIVRLER